MPAAPDLAKSMLDFAGSEVVAETSMTLESGGEVGPDVVRDAFDRGLLTMRLPVELGGSGLSMSDYVRIMESTGRLPGVIRVLIHGQNCKWEFFTRFGTEEQQSVHLRRFARGNWYLSFAMTEPESGPGRDVGTTAHRVDDGWAITGRKHLVTRAMHAEVFVIVARVEDSDDVTCFLVRSDASGLTRTAMAPTMGLRGIGLGSLEMESVRVGQAAVLGPVGEGLSVAGAFLDVSRVSLSATAVGLAQEAFNTALDHAENRVTFGQAIATRQAVQLILADMAVGIAASRQLVSSAAEAIDAGDASARLKASIAKRHSATMVTDVTDLSMRVLGGTGYTSQSPVERLARDARAYWFEEGTSEVQSLIIAREVLAERRRRRRKR